MGVQAWTFVLVGISFALYIGVAIWSRAGSTKEFYVAGGGVPPLANGMATAADCLAWAEERTGDDRALPLVQGLAALAEPARGRAPRTTPPANAP